jgi:hypothetical protein
LPDGVAPSVAISAFKEPPSLALNEERVASLVVEAVIIAVESQLILSLSLTRHLRDFSM